MNEQSNTVRADLARPNNEYRWPLGIGEIRKLRKVSWWSFHGVQGDSVYICVMYL